jgi:hypothetical protein
MEPLVVFYLRNPILRKLFYQGLVLSTTLSSDDLAPLYGGVSVRTSDGYVSWLPEKALSDGVAGDII